MIRTSKFYIDDFIDYAEKAVVKLKDVTKEEFIRDEEMQVLITRRIVVLGELVKRLPKELIKANPDIEWKDMIRTRDFLAHHYDNVVVEILYDAVKDKLPSTIKKMKRIKETLD